MNFVEFRFKITGIHDYIFHRNCKNNKNKTIQTVVPYFRTRFRTYFKMFYQDTRVFLFIFLSVYSFSTRQPAPISMRSNFSVNNFASGQVFFFNFRCLFRNNCGRKRTKKRTIRPNDGLIIFDFIFYSFSCIYNRVDW